MAGREVHGAPEDPPYRYFVSLNALFLEVVPRLLAHAELHLSAALDMALELGSRFYHKAKEQ